jgi:uncharacterized protein YhaN
VRLLELEIIAFGAIANRRIDLSRAEPALHIVYGPNEAGKSTTLRAILALLFGVEHHSPDAKLYGSDPLRIKARIADREGRVLAVTRRKGTKNTLLDGADQPLDETVLQRALGGLPPPVFRIMFALDHERLRQGGEQLRLGQGDLGESLFQAGLGVSGLHQVLSLLGREAEELWKPRGQKPLNQAIDAHTQARRSVREHGKRADAFRVQEQELSQAELRKAELSQQRSALQAEQSRLRRLLSVLPMLAKRRETRERRAALGQVAALPEASEELRRRAQTERLTCESQIAQLQSQIENLAARRAELAITESLLELSPEYVRAIRNRLGSHLKAAADLPSRSAELRQLELQAAAALRALGDPAPLAEIEALRVDTATQTRIVRLAREHSGHRERVQAAEQGLQTAQADLAEAQAELAALPRAPAIEGVAPAAADGAKVALPSEAAVESFRQRFERIDQARTRSDSAAEALDEREERVRIQLDRIAREGAPPTERDLARARAERDALLPQIRAVFAGEVSAHPRLVLEFEALQQRADETADRLRRETSRVAELAQLHAEAEAIGRERERLLARRAELQSEASALAHEWQQAFAALGLLPQAPRLMQPLLARVSGLLQSGERGRAQAQRRKREAERELERWQGQWSQLMARLRLPAEASAEEAQAVLEELRRLFDRADAAAQLRTRIAAIESDAAQFERDVRALVSSHAPELSGLPLEQAAEQLVRRHADALRDVEQRAHIDADLREFGAKRLLLQGVAEQAERTLAELMRKAGVSDLAALEQAEQRFRQACELDRQLAGIEDDLLGLGEGASLPELAAQAAEVGPDRIRARLSDIDDELAAVEEARDDVNGRILGLELGLERWRDDQAAQAASEAEQHLSRIRTLAQSYASRRLAVELLQREIRRYRDANQGPIVSRGSELFARLTLGRYPRLQVGYGEQDEPVLRCVDDAGRNVAIEALSDGTRDQLYLALRLASLERFARNNEPMPLVLDDALIHFDDERARAALQVLGELCADMQVLFFTHHKRLLELARDAIEKPRLCEHRLAEERVQLLLSPQ